MSACDDQVILFRQTFPTWGCAVTAANIRKAAEAGLDLHWWAPQFLPAATLRVYQEATAPALIAALGLKDKP